METQAQVTAPREQFPATVVAVVDAYTVVVNRGSDHGIRQGQRFLIYTLSQEELVDPESRESLGRLEIVKGTGRAAHVQPRLTTIRSDGQSYEAPKRIVRKRSGPMTIFGETVEEIETPSRGISPFDDASIGDKAKPI